MQNRAIVLIGQRRNKSWPKDVPSVSHPVIAKIIEKNNKKHIHFEKGITGSETFEINQKFLNDLKSKKTDTFCLNAGSTEWPSLHIKTKDLQNALEFLQTPKSINWIAHIGIPNKDGNIDYKLMVDSDYTFDEKADPEHVKEHFEIELGIYDQNDDESSQKIRPHVYHTMIAPRGMENMPHLEKSLQQMKTQEKQSKKIWDHLLQKEIEEVKDIEKSRGLQVWEGKIDRILKRDDLYVKGVLLTEAGNKINFLASGDPQKSIDQVRSNDIIKIIGKSNQNKNNDFDINLVSAKIIQRGSVKKDLQR